jgi:hypothetical protein
MQIWLNLAPSLIGLSQPIEIIYVNKLNLNLSFTAYVEPTQNHFYITESL